MTSTIKPPAPITLDLDRGEALWFFGGPTPSRRFLLVTEPGGFDEFTRAVGQPAEELEPPAPASEPSDVEALTRLAAGFGLEIMGPPGIPRTRRAATEHP